MARYLYLIIILAVLGPSLPAVAQEDTIVITPDLELIRITDNVWRHVSYQMFPDGSRITANGLVYRDGGRVLIVDTPWTDEQTGALVDWIEEQLDVRVSDVIVTHWHDDCMGGLGTAIGHGCSTYGLRLTARICREKELAVPAILFDDTFTRRLERASFECAYYGGGHTIDNIEVWLPNERILFGGCLVKSMSATGLGNTDDAVLDEWPETIRAIREAYPDIAVVVPGHGDPGGPELLDHTLDLLEQSNSK